MSTYTDILKELKEFKKCGLNGTNKRNRVKTPNHGQYWCAPILEEDYKDHIDTYELTDILETL